MSIKVHVTREEHDRLNAAALEWSRNNRSFDLARRPLKRFAGCLGWARLDREGFPVGSNEFIVHVEARSHDDAIARIKAVLMALAPELTETERAENVDLYNVYSEEEHPAFVLRAVVGTAGDQEILDGDPIWIFPGGIWPGLHDQYQRPQVQIPEFQTSGNCAA